jgi:hypothetical protein
MRVCGLPSVRPWIRQREADRTGLSHFRQRATAPSSRGGGESALAADVSWGGLQPKPRFDSGFGPDRRGRGLQSRRGWKTLPILLRPPIGATSIASPLKTEPGVLSLERRSLSEQPLPMDARLRLAGCVPSLRTSSRASRAAALIFTLCLRRRPGPSSGAATRSRSRFLRDRSEKRPEACRPTLVSHHRAALVRYGYVKA